MQKDMTYKIKIARLKQDAKPLMKGCWNKTFNYTPYGVEMGEFLKMERYNNCALKLKCQNESNIKAKGHNVNILKHINLKNYKIEI